MEYKGYLTIDLDEGIAIFMAEDSEGRQYRMLRVTHLPKPIPVDFTIDVVAIRNVTSYTQIESDWRDAPQGINKTSDSQLETRRAMAKKASLAMHPSTGRYSELDEQDEVCRPCRRIHSPADYTKWGPFTFIAGHEYRVWTKTDTQKYPRSFRMQFMGMGPSQFKYQLTFNARGPDRSTKGQYAGTQQVDARSFTKVEEVDRNPAERYAERIERHGQ